MVADNAKKEIKQISDVKKSFLTEALKSAKKARKKVRKNIANDTLPEVPKKINDFMGEGVA